MEEAAFAPERRMLSLGQNGMGRLSHVEGGPVAMTRLNVLGLDAESAARQAS